MNLAQNTKLRRKYHAEIFIAIKKTCRHSYLHHTKFHQCILTNYWSKLGQTWYYNPGKVLYYNVWNVCELIISTYTHTLSKILYISHPQKQQVHPNFVPELFYQYKQFLKISNSIEEAISLQGVTNMNYCAHIKLLILIFSYLKFIFSPRNRKSILSKG